ncbi:MAG: AtpZ/AtpI family protein [Dehalococcoidia bacterium]|jgi:hypothetical protein|nr:MAG: AtpZ/AtpI family protein [Dehalococcoidia bacterium]
MPVLKQENAEKPEKRRILSGLWFLFNVGWYVALSLVVPTAIGLWLDAPERFHSQPLCTLIGLVVGITAAGYGLYRMLRGFIKEQKDMDEMYMKKNSIKEQDSE